jgi:UDP-glucuronate 4-epimerase
MLLLTGAAGFVGYSVARRMLEQGADIVGIDEVNSYYDPQLKRARLADLQRFASFRFVEADISRQGALAAALDPAAVTHILHLAAQAGVRYSLEAPFAYEHANTLGHLSVLEYARAAPKLKHLVYASSSSVYGDRSDGPFRETDRCDAPASLYAATKRACELMSETYASLYGIPQTGLRFFTVYGPFGRPDMAYWSFTEKMLRGEPITLYGEGKLMRDFTFIGDMAPAVIRALELPPQGADAGLAPHLIVNLGNSKPSSVSELVDAIEAAAGIKAERIMAPQQKVEVTATYADITRAAGRFGFAPATPLREGIARFVEWYRHYKKN